MNSNFKFDFDLGIGSNKPRSLNDQKNKPAPYSYTSGSAAQQQPKPAWQPNKPSWTHQPAPSQPSRGGAASLNGPTSMVGDIFGKSWGSTSGPSGSGIGIAEKNPNLFGDLVNSALGQGKSTGNGNAPLKNAAPVSGNKSAYSMGNLSNSLPKVTPNPGKSGGSWGSNESFGSFTSGYNSSAGGVNSTGSGAAKTTNLGGPSMNSMAGAGGGMNSNKDPFSSLTGFAGLKQQGVNLNSSNKAGAKVSSGDDSFGDSQNAAKSSTASAFPSSGFTTNNSSFGTPNSIMGDFGMNFSSPSQAPQAATQNTSVDQFDSLFSTSSASGGGTATASDGFGGQHMEDDWGLGSDFGGGNDSGGTTTELEGLPPPPAGVSSSTAKSKGMDNYKQGQYADAIKWLLWAEVLSKAGDNVAEVLTCRASCYKEVGEYKKAVADCTKVYILLHCL